MTLFAFFLLLSSVFWGGLIYKTWQLDDTQKNLITDRVEDAKQKSTERIQNLNIPNIQTAPPAVDAELAAQFRAWSTTVFDSEELYSWMAGLSDEHFLVITEFVAQFCDDMGFDLHSVIEGDYAEPDLAETLEDVVVHIAQSMQLVFSVREKLLVYESAKPTEPELTEQLQQMMANSVASVSNVLNRATTTTASANGSADGQNLNGQVK